MEGNKTEMMLKGGKERKKKVKSGDKEMKEGER